MSFDISILDTYSSDYQQALSFSFVINPNCIPDDSEIEIFEFNGLTIPQNDNSTKKKSKSMHAFNLFHNYGKSYNYRKNTLKKPENWTKC